MFISKRPHQNNKHTGRVSFSATEVKELLERFAQGGDPIVLVVVIDPEFDNIIKKEVQQWMIDGITHHTSDDGTKEYWLLPFTERWRKRLA